MFRRLVVLSIMTAALLVTPTAAYATSDLERLIATAERDGWGPAEWEWFEQWAALQRVAAIAERANAGDRHAIEQYVWLLWGDQHTPEMLRIIHRESRFHVAAKNPISTASGLTQQLSLHAWRYERRGWDWHTDRFNAVRNLEIAYELWLEAGYAPWRVG